MESAIRDQIAAELHAIAMSHGGIIQAADVVEAARDKSTALHGQFIWDDARAAHAQRLERARWLIRTVYVEVIADNPRTLTRAFVSLPADRLQPNGGYRTITDVLSNAEMREAMMNDAKQDMRRFIAKYHRLEELLPMIRLMRRHLARDTCKAS